ncbi:MAG: GNAT family N-acetyltransferase [Muribaculaceae bacterium]|nr:GNAT family N-acetyltransferase [Muribaculaceae bacterium]
MMTLRRYSPHDKNDWDEFVEKSKNATFLHRRDYMDYHADRFRDFSIMVFRENRLYGILPACALGEEWISHAGLTYGGLLTDEKCTAADTLEIFRRLRSFLAESGFARMIYSPSPHIYHRLPSEEDLYALFRIDAGLAVRKISSVIDRTNPIKWRNIRKAGIRKAEKAGIEVGEDNDFSGFWKILENNLNEKYAVSPVHSLDEIIRLHTLFPDNIRLFTARLNGEIVAGTVIYKTERVIHSQYISADERGKATGALDLLFHHLLADLCTDVPYFDFGNSNERQGSYLNESLIYQKEGFGARAVCYDTYSLSLTNEYPVQA